MGLEDLMARQEYEFVLGACRWSRTFRRLEEVSDVSGTYSHAPFEFCPPNSVIWLLATEL